MMIAIGVSSWLSVAAQKHGHPGKCDGKQIGKIAEELSLSETQITQMQNLMENFHDKFKSIKEDENLTKDEKREKIMAEHENRKEKTKEILNEEQWEKFQANFQERMGNRHHGLHMHKHFAGRAQQDDNPFHKMLMEKRASFETELTSKEKETIAGVRKQLSVWREEHKDGFCDLSEDERKQNRQAHKEVFEPIKEIAENHKESISTIFNEIKPGKKDCPQGKMKNRKKHFAGKGKKGGGRAVHFLLMESAGTDSQSLNTVNDLVLFPNPAKDVMQIKFMLNDQGAVKIELLDKKARIIKILDETTRDKGLHKVACNVEGLQNGEVYFVRITISGQEVVEKFIKL